MKKTIRLTKKDRTLRGEIRLDGSKSISNRAIVMLAYAGQKPSVWLENLSTSKDTQILLQLIDNQFVAEQNAAPEIIHDAGDAGTTFRFLTAFLAIRPGKKILTGSARMKERPIGPLVEALRELGFEISYLENDGFPPLMISDFGFNTSIFATNALEKEDEEKLETQKPKSKILKIPASTSSQFLSAILMLAPTLPGGLEIQPQGQLVSKPYVEMTMKMMRRFGAKVEWLGNSILVQPAEYQLIKSPAEQNPKLKVEADWSAASYWYSMAAFADDVDLKLLGLFRESVQGDSVLAEMMIQFGIETVFENDGIRLLKNGKTPPPIFEMDFLACPDIVQTLAVCCAGLGVHGVFSGLETLAIKETDRIAALKNELRKIGVSFSKLPPHFSKKKNRKTFFMLDGKAKFSGRTIPRFSTYGDHRMALAFAPLAFLGEVEIESAEVVSKSYPGFWEDLQRVGFEVSRII